MLIRFFEVGCMQGDVLGALFSTRTKYTTALHIIKCILVIVLIYV